MHAADLYAETHGRVAALVADLDPALAVPACPGWTVRDVVAHVVGLAADIVSGRVDGYAGEEWTEVQVRERAGRSLQELLAEWDELLPAFIEINRDLAASALPELIPHVLGPLPKAMFEAAFHVDLLHHEHDLLGAAGAPRTVPTPADIAVMKSQLANVRLQFKTAGLPTLRLIERDLGQTWDIGRDEPAATLTGTAIDFLRSFGGRRTLAEIAELDWQGESEGMADHVILPFFHAPAEPIPGG